MATRAERAWISTISDGDRLLKESLWLEADRLRRDLLSDRDTSVERLLIDQIVVTQIHFEARATDAARERPGPHESTADGDVVSRGVRRSAYDPSRENPRDRAPHGSAKGDAAQPSCRVGRRCGISPAASGTVISVCIRPDFLQTDEPCAPISINGSPFRQTFGERRHLAHTKYVAERRYGKARKRRGVLVSTFR